MEAFYLLSFSSHPSSITIELTASGFTLGGGSKCAGSTDTLYRKTNDEFAALKSRSRSNSCTSNLHLTSLRFSSKTDLNRTPSAGGQSQSRHLGSRRNIYEDLIAPPRRANSAEDGHSLTSEPIYAVVDLKVKKARRLNQLNSSFREHQHEVGDDEEERGKSDQTIKADMMRDKETGRLKEKTKTSANDQGAAKYSVPPAGSNDYEELNELTIENIADFEDDPDSSDEAENIYEPVSVFKIHPKPQSSHSINHSRSTSPKYPCHRPQRRCPRRSTLRADPPK